MNEKTTLKKISIRGAIILLIVASGMLTTAFKSHLPGGGADWVAPASANSVTNPLKGNADATAAGKKTYTIYCVVCHGAKGKGDGIAAAGLQKQPADHTSARVQSETDGSLFWKMSEGRSPMPPYKGVLTETQRWQLVNYIRTLAKH